MAFSENLLSAGEDIWEAQKAHPFVRELAAGTLAEEAFLHWVRQDYRYLLDYARTFALAGVKARDEETTNSCFEVAHTIPDVEVDLHREFAASFGVSAEGLERVEKAPTCVAYTNFLQRTAYQGSFAEIAAAVYPCGRGYLDVAEHMADLAAGEHRYTPFVEKYTSETFRESVAWMTDLVDRCGEEYPGERDAMGEAFLTSARLEYEFWEIAYTCEGWGA